jgi:hypothetical protein
MHVNENVQQEKRRLPMMQCLLGEGSPWKRVQSNKGGKRRKRKRKRRKGED